MQYLSAGVDSAELDIFFVFRMWLLMPSFELGFGLKGLCGLAARYGFKPLLCNLFAV